MIELSNHCAKFVPDSLRAKFPAGGSVQPSAHADTLQASVLFADIVGYTAWMSDYSQEGAEGIENLSRVLDDFFQAALTEVHRAGGDVVHFAGDSFIALWPQAAGQSIGQLAQVAAECAFAVQSATQRTQSKATRLLQMRIGLAVGPLQQVCLGGVKGQWRYLVTGLPIATAGSAMQLAHPNRVAASGDFWHWLGGKDHDECLAGGFKQLAPERIKMNTVKLALEIKPVTASPVIRSFLPQNVLLHLQAGDFSELKEFRQTCLLFIRLNGLDFEAINPQSSAQRVFCHAQAVIGQFGGALLRLGADDKGVSLLVAWGVPGHQFEDDVTRCIQTALQIQAELKHQSLSCGMGIATGRVLCGLAGARWRCEYTVGGVSVNLAAKLMVAADDGILCCEATRARASARVRFAKAEKLIPKGTPNPIVVFRPLEVVFDDKKGWSDQNRREEPIGDRMVGREQESGVLNSRLQLLMQGVGCSVCVWGEPGVGKSTLGQSLLDRASRRGACCWRAFANATEHSTPYFVWRQLLPQLLGIANFSQAVPEDCRNRVRAQIASAPGLLDRLVLLNDVLPFGFEANAFSLRMTEKVKADSIQQLLVHLLANAVKQSPVLLVLEDTHWMDSLSRVVFEKLADQKLPLMLVMLSRPVSHDATLNQLAAQPFPHPTLNSAQQSKTQACLPAYANMLHIELAQMGMADTLSLLCQRLDLRSLDEAALTLVHHRTGGNPFFAIELTRSLLQMGYFQSVERVCQIDSDASKIESTQIPLTIQAVVAGRIDLLPLPAQRVLKLASVLGRSFSASSILEIRPEGIDVAELVVNLQRAVALGLLAQTVQASTSEDSHDASFAFNHALTQEITYELLPVSEKKRLHQAAARWIHAKNAANLPSVYALLAYHWSRTSDADQASFFLLAAGEQSVEQYANNEAIDHLLQARTLIQTQPSVVDRLKLARCERSLGYAYLGLGQLNTSKRHLMDSFRWEGKPLPRTRFGFVLALVGHIALQGIYLLRSRSVWGELASGSDQTLRENSKGLFLLGNIAYFESDLITLVYTALRSINYMERAGPSAELARVNSGVALAAGGARLHTLALRYCERAEQTAREVSDQSAIATANLFTAMYLGGVGSWSEGIVKAQRAIDLSEHLGNERQICEAYVTLAFIYFYSGETDSARVCFTQCETRGRQRKDLQVQGWGLLGMARLHLTAGRIDDAQPLLQSAAALPLDRLSLIELNGQRALFHLAKHDLAQALAEARLGLELLARSPPTSLSTLFGTACIAHVLTELQASFAYESDYANSKLLSRQARLALRALRFYARVFPIGGPLANLIAARQCELKSKWAKAVAHWQTACSAAQKLNIPYDEMASLERWQTQGNRLSYAAQVQRLQKLRDRHRVGQTIWTQTLVLTAVTTN